MVTVGFSEDDSGSDEDFGFDMIEDDNFQPYWFAGLKEVPHCETRSTAFAQIFNCMEAMDVFKLN